MATWPLVPVLGSAQSQLYHLIHVDDLKEIFILAAVHPNALGEVFIAGDPTALSLKNIIRIISAECGSKALIIRIPAWPIFLVATLCETFCRPFGWSPPLYRRRVAFFTKDRSFDTSKLRRCLGYTYNRTTELGLRETTRWYREQGWVKT